MSKLPGMKIGGREIPLYYSTYETIAIQEEIGCTAYQLKEVVFGAEKIDEELGWEPENMRLTVANDPAKMKKLGTLVRILGNAGLEEEGQAPDLTDKWILRNMKPGSVLLYAVIALAVISTGNSMEAKEENQGPVDEILEEENAKKQPGS